MLPRYIDIFVRSDLEAAALCQQLAQHLGISLSVAHSQHSDVLAVYSDPTTPHHWLDLWMGLKRHPSYTYQIYVGASKHDLHGHYRVNLAWWLLERLAGQLPIVYEVGDGQQQLISERIDGNLSRDLLTQTLSLCKAACQQLFINSAASPSTIARQMKRDDWQMKKINKKGSPVIAEYQTPSGKLTLETNYFWSLNHFEVTQYRYFLNGAGVSQRDFAEIAARLRDYPTYLAQDFMRLL